MLQTLHNILGVGSHSPKIVAQEYLKELRLRRDIHKNRTSTKTGAEVTEYEMK